MQPFNNGCGKQLERSTLNDNGSYMPKMTHSDISTAGVKPPELAADDRKSAETFGRDVEEERFKMNQIRLISSALNWLSISTTPWKEGLA